MDKNVQLKEEEIVGQETVLSDIYPRTDTSSVEDNRTGKNLDVTLDQIYESINNKLTRVVNSVNGRSGSIVLTQGDVGLSNVDNVSFDTIKDWTIDAVTNAFSDKNLVLVRNKEALENSLNYSDPSYNHASYFATNWTTEDLRPSIGRIRVPSPDDTESPYKIYPRMLNTIEKTDKAFRYDKGELNLNLAPDQKSLVIGSDGLRIDPDTLRRHILVFENFYCIENDYTGESTDESVKFMDTGFLDDDTIITSPYRATIQIGVRKIRSRAGGTGSYFHINPDMGSLFTSDSLIFITGTPHDFNITDDRGMYDDTRYNPSLKQTGPLLGYVVIDDEDETIYHFYFTPINMSVGFGLMNSAANPWKEKAEGYGFHNKLNVNLMIDEKDGYDGIENNPSRISYSSLQALSAGTSTFDSTHDIDPERDNVDLDEGSQFASMNYLMTPEGRIKILKTHELSFCRKGGLFIPTDSSLCAMPYNKYGYDVESAAGSERSEAFKNWFASTPYYANSDLINNHIGFMNSPTFIGVNLLKGYTGEGENKNAFALSGLRVVDPGQFSLSKHNSRTLNWEMFGMNEESDSDRFINALYSHDGEKLIHQGDLDTPLKPSDLSHTGGLMVNVGKGLEIMPYGMADNGVTFDRTGKVNVRLGKGLEFDKYNRITLANESSGAGLFNASRLAVRSRNVVGEPGQRTEEESARSYYEATTFHDPYLYGDNNLFTQSIIELGDGLAFELTRNDFLELILKRSTVQQINDFNFFRSVYPNGILGKTWENLYNDIMTGDTIFLPHNPRNVDHINDYTTYILNNPYSTDTVEQSQSPSTLLMDWIRFNPDQGYDVGKTMTIGDLIAAYKQNHPDSE